MATFRYDLTNQRFGRWTVLEFTGKTGSSGPLWKCQCDCGTIREVSGSSLRRGTSTGCGCVKRKPKKDLTNQRFGRLVALEPTEKRSKSGAIIWKCKCDCGNVCERSSTDLLRTDRCQSCGCINIETLSKNWKSLVGKRFGLLTVLEETEERKEKRKSKIWKCQCDCGNIKYIDTNSLTSGNTSSCGCINYSIGEKNIENILKENNISFKSQYTNKELKRKRFDFAILNADKVVRLIEFDGQQHYNDINGIWGSPENLLDIQERDTIKNQYALSHNIPLVRIPYWERDNITLEMILGDKYLIK